MKKKILLFLFLIASVVCLNTSNVAYANSNEIDEETLEKAINAYKKGVYLYRSKSYSDAIAFFNEALQYNPKMTDAYYNIASILVSQKKYDEAYNTYVKIIALNPKDYDAIMQAAKISYNRKNYALAIKYLECIPDDYEYYHVARQMYKDAKSMFDKEKARIERAKITKADNNRKI